jgi:hypothetical protein
LNSDIILSKRLIACIKSELSSPRANDVFYRVRYRGEIPLGYNPGESTPATDLTSLSPEHPDQICILGVYSGDAAMFSRHVFFKVATGYNEGDVGHRTSFNQASMDGEILWNLYKKGKKRVLFESPYYHISHGRPIPRDSHYSQEVYENSPDWGFINYNETRINVNTVFISAFIQTPS